MRIKGRAFMTDAEIRAARERCEKATAGPWMSDIHVSVEDGKIVKLPEAGVMQSCDAFEKPLFIANERHTRQQIERAFSEPPYHEGLIGLWPEDADFIAHAITDLPAALDEITRLRSLALSLLDEWKTLDLAEIVGHGSPPHLMPKHEAEYARRRAKILGEAVAVEK